MQIKVMLVIRNDDTRAHIEALLEKMEGIQLVACLADGNLAVISPGTEADLILYNHALLHWSPELLERFNNPLRVVVTETSAFDATVFNERLFDHLMLPVSAERLHTTLSHARAELWDDRKYGALASAVSIGNKYFIKDRENYYWINAGDVYCFQAVGNYVKVYHPEFRPMLYSSLNYLEKRLSSAPLFRANRSYLCNLDHIKCISSSPKGMIILTMANDINITLSQRQTVQFREKLSL